LRTGWQLTKECCSLPKLNAKSENLLSSIRILVADDYEGWRRQISLLLQARPELQVICEASDGLEAIQRAEELKPDLIVLDIGLPTINGIEAARRIRKLVPESKILFLSQESSADVVQEALNWGALGYVVKAHAGTELLAAVGAVLRGERFVSSIKGYNFTKTPGANTPHHHEVLFYSDDAVFLERFTRCIGAGLKAGNSAIANVTKPHLEILIQKLKAERVDVDRAIQQGTFISLNVADTLSTFMANGLIDPVRFLRVIRGFIEAAAQAAKVEHPRVVFCGEGVGLLWVQGKTDAAIRVEQLCSELAKTHEVDILCAYPLSSIHDEEDEHKFQNICAEHSGVYSQ
jgi:DNA-binding NarL/FixJ family response regulator